MRADPEDLGISGFHIPEVTLVIMDTCSLHRVMTSWVVRIHFAREDEKQGQCHSVEAHPKMGLTILCSDDPVGMRSQELILFDVTPFTLGVEIVEDVMTKVNNSMPIELLMPSAFM